jgi:hypothetical protein
MERGDYFSALLRGWWLIVILGLVGLAVGLVSPRHSVTTSYVSTSAVGSPPSSGPGNSGSGGGGLSADQIMYYADTDGVLQAASQKSGLDWPVYLVRDRLQLIGPPSVNGNSNGPSSGQDGVIDVQVTAPTLAASLALNDAFDQALGDSVNADINQGLLQAETQTEQKLADVMRQIASNQLPFGLTTQALDVQINDLQDYLASLVVSEPSSGYSIVEAAVLQQTKTVTTGAAANSRALRATGGLLIGLALGALAAIGLWLLDRRLKTAKRAQTAFGYPVVAEIPSATSDATEPYRMLWLSVFREPLPPPPLDGTERLYEGESPVLDDGVGVGSGRAEIT